MTTPDEKSDREHMTGASGIRSEPADEGVIHEAADVVQPPPKPPRSKNEEEAADRPALPPGPEEPGFVNET